MKKGLLLNNIGTPNSPSTKDVKIYLDEFLMDPGVIGLPFLLRWILVKGLITPRRSSTSAAKYKSVWMAEGSPLMVFSQAFSRKLGYFLGSNWLVRVGMRYGTPSIRETLEEFRVQNVEEVILAPLFPQYAEATTGSAIKECERVLKEMDWRPQLKILPPFFDKKEFLVPQANLIRPILNEVDHVLFSFHGLPESQVRENEGCLESKDCCERPKACAMNCYRAQSVATAKSLAAILDLPREKWSFSFQSRLGPAKWISPATDEVLKELAAKGVRRLAVACPSFTADCLETLEEIGIEGKKEFLHAGGKEYRLIPCVNAESSWVESFPRIINEI